MPTSTLDAQRDEYIHMSKQVNDSSKETCTTHRRKGINSTSCVHTTRVECTKELIKISNIALEHASWYNVVSEA